MLFIRAIARAANGRITAAESVVVGNDDDDDEIRAF